MSLNGAALMQAAVVRDGLLAVGSFHPGGRAAWISTDGVTWAYAGSPVPGTTGVGSALPTGIAQGRGSVVVIYLASDGAGNGATSGTSAAIARSALP